MTERITEAELADVERALVPSLSYAKGVTEGEANLARGVWRYIAEVRRLRGLIAAYVDRRDSGTVFEMVAAGKAIEAEAYAIRDEGANARLGAAVDDLGRTLDKLESEPRFMSSLIMVGQATPLRVWVDGKPFVPEKP